MSRFEADIALELSRFRQSELARHQADARKAMSAPARADESTNKLRAFIIAMTAPNSTSFTR